MIFNIGVSAPRFPIFSATINGTEYNFTGSNIDNNDIAVKQEDNFIKIWLKKSGSIKFDLLLKNIDVCVVGKGASGGNATTSRDSRGRGIFYAGGGGKGGQVNSAFGKTMLQNTPYSFNVGSVNNIAVLGKTISASTGTGANGGAGGFHSDHTGAWTVPGNGTNGSFAFNDSSFDGIRYGSGGGGGALPFEYTTPGANGVTSGARGMGGHGATNYGDNPPSGGWPGDPGIDGIVLMRIPLL